MTRKRARYDGPAVLQSESIAPSIQYLVWRHVKLALRPLSNREIAEQMGIRFSSAYAATHNLGRAGAFVNVGGKSGRHQVSIWIAVAGAEVPRNGRIANLEKVRPKAKAKREELPVRVPPCELARIFGLVARVNA